MDDGTNDFPSRAKWGFFLSLAERSQVDDHARRLSDQFQVERLKPSVSGLGMLQVSESVARSPFHLGEFSVSRAVVRLSDSQGNQISGASVVMADDEQLAENLAILDGVLAARWPGHDRIVELVQAGETQHRQRVKLETQIFESTAVDFSTLNEGK